MLRWIAIVLMIALPLRSGMAAAQICPWMAAQAMQTQEYAQAQTLAGQSAPVSSSSITEAIDDCPEMTATGGVCHLQKACTATPILQDAPTQVQHYMQPLHVVWRPVFTISIDTAVPQRIPITSLS